LGAAARFFAPLGCVVGTLPTSAFRTARDEARAAAGAGEGVVAGLDAEPRTVRLALVVEVTMSGFLYFVFSQFINHFIV
jgi:phage shock protein PspC (stress-responsive transcriptional regulator)